VFDEVLDSNVDLLPAVLDVMYSVRRKNEALEALAVDLPSALGGRINARSAG
jgi:hypothetical protein